MKFGKYVLAAIAGAACSRRPIEFSLIGNCGECNAGK